MNKKMTTYQIVVTAMFAALMCVLGPLTIPIGLIPISFTNMVVVFAVYLLGGKLGTLATIVYILLGTFGLPVFSGATGGLQKVLGPTGGFIIGFIPLAIIVGIALYQFKGNKIAAVLGIILGEFVLYVCGVAWFMYSLKQPLGYAMTACVYPYLPGDLIKMVLVVILGSILRQRLMKAGFVKPYRTEEQ